MRYEKIVTFFGFSVFAFIYPYIMAYALISSGNMTAISIGALIVSITMINVGNLYVYGRRKA